MSDVGIDGLINRTGTVPPAALDTTGAVAGQSPMFNGTTVVWSATGVGSVSSVGLSMPAGIFAVSGSPITSAGTIAVVFAPQPANVALMGPPSGAAAAPTMRALVVADMPAAVQNAVTNQVSGALAQWAFA